MESEVNQLAVIGQFEGCIPMYGPLNLKVTVKLQLVLNLKVRGPINKFYVLL